MKCEKEGIWGKILPVKRVCIIDLSDLQGVL